MNRRWLDWLPLVWNLTGFVLSVAFAIAFAEPWYGVVGVVFGFFVFQHA